MQKGKDGAEDAHKHIMDHAPAFVLTALGDAFLSLRGKDFTSDDVRRIAGPTVEAWLTAEPERRNCFSGWFTARRKAFRLKRVGGVPSTREDAHGRFIGLWRFPLPVQSGVR